MTKQERIWSLRDR